MSWCCFVRNIGVELLLVGLEHLEHAMHVTNYNAVLLQEAAVTGTLFGHTKRPALHVGNFFLDGAQLVMGVGAGRSAERA
jgi:hypothetical protein